MEVRILGPVEVHHLGQLVRLVGRQHRLIIGVLALEANGVVPYDRLIHFLWGDCPPRRARAVLHSRISELRAALSTLGQAAADAIPTRGRRGYMLCVPDDCVDALRFQRMAGCWRDIADDCAARAMLRRALDLWRGPVLGGVELTEPYRSLCYPLESARLSALEDLYEIELRLGNHMRVVDELVRLAMVNPIRERLVKLMLIALYRCGRTVEGLQVYDRWRRWLSEEMGVDPSAEVRRLHRAMLRGDPLPVTASARDGPSEALLDAADARDDDHHAHHGRWPPGLEG